MADAPDSIDRWLGGELPQVVEGVLAGRSRYAAVLGDGFALSRLLSDGAVGLVLGDLPYDERTHTRARSLKGGGTDIDIDFDALPPVESFLPGLLRCSGRWVLCFCAMEQLGEYKAAAGAEAWIRSGVWVRTNGTPQISADRPAQGAEGIAIMHRATTKKRWNSGGKRGAWTGPRDDDPTRGHPTKKPLWLMEALLRDFAEPGDIVLDPTMGEGTTGEACLRLGLPFIGCELKQKYHAMAVERLRRAADAGVQLTLPERQPRAKQGVLFK